ncbi:uncharacterized protein LOC133915652 isoform X2 [Phragmites australis]|uniref:uncharacterized protein LOC133915652 isoform X2 n=1 Tax=Phragmites australis TaxID=29695 RepID=UPI002D76668B|nr:uncharacterized protein LOC133915652 isoform X2 [Phragmites australis]
MATALFSALADSSCPSRWPVGLPGHHRIIINSGGSSPARADLDDTLYPGDTGIGLALKRNIDEFLVAKLGVTAERAAAMRVELFRTHGSTLSGLIALGYEVHPDEYHSYVHGRLPYDRIAADPQLARLLQSIPQRKVLFTNSDRAHMKRALQRLSVDEACFDAIVCFETMNPHLFGEAREEHANAARPVVVLKPSVEAIVAAIRVADSNPRRTVGKRVRSKEADYALENIGNLRRVIPEIWGVAGGESSGQPDLGIDKKGMRSDLESIIQPASIQA